MRPINEPNAKFYAPALAANMVARPALTKILKKAAKKRIIFVTAPDGSGKTTAVAQWLRQSEQEVLWLSLDEYDNAPTIFFHLLCERFCAVQPENQALSDILHDPAFNANPVDNTIRLLQQVNFTEQEYVLVIDDAHFLSDEKLQEAFLAVQQHFPETVSTVLITHDAIPPETLAFAGGKEACVLITAKELAFNTTEIKKYFRRFNRRLTESEAALVKQTTKGWAMGVHVLASQKIDPNDQSDRELFEHYFAQSVWDLLSSDLQDFLLRTSIAAKLTPELADRLTNRTDSERLLAELATQNLFITCFNEEHYRYHPVFAAFLQERLAQRERRLIEGLYQIAADYWLEQNEVFLARGYALKSGSQERITQTNYAVINTSGRGTNISVEEFINVFCTYSKNTLFAEKDFPYPYLYSQFAGYYFLIGDAAMTEYCLDALYASLPTIKADYPQFLADALLMAFVDYRKELPQILKEFLKSPALSKFKERLAWSTITMQLPFIHRSSRDMCGLGGFSGLKIPTAAANAILGSRGTSMMLLMQAGLLFEKNQLRKALALLKKAGALMDQPDIDEETIFCFLMQQLALYQALGEDDRVKDAEKALTYFFKTTDNQVFRKNYQAFQTRRALHNGDPVAAKQWLAQLSEHDHSFELFRIYQHGTTARALLVLNRKAEAARFFQRLKQLAKDFRRPADLAEALILEAVLNWHTNQQDQAVDLLKEALLMMQEYDYVRVIAAEGAAVLPILERLMILHSTKEPNLKSGFLNKVHALTQKNAQQQPGIAKNLPPAKKKLSKQQLRMLDLLAQGYKNAEIAEQTGLTIATVKYHLSAAYRKLGVTNAADAVQAARKRRILK